MVNIDYATGYRDGFQAGIQQGMFVAGEVTRDRQIERGVISADVAPKPKRRKTSAYNRKYKAAFRKVAPKYKLKSGKWRNNGFRRAVKEAHKIAGGKKR